jgi:Uma2 family endonuclease
MATSTLSIQREGREPHPLRWTKEQYHKMGEMGLFEGRRVELIEGEIIEMAPMLSPHWVTVGLTADEMRRIFHSGYIVSEQRPISLPDESEPEPDVAVIRGRIRDFKNALPSGAALVVEVSDTTLAYDRGRKAALYARAGIQEYWIVNVSRRELEVRRRPTQEGYSETRVLKESETVSTLEMSDAVIKIADLLP